MCNGNFGKCIYAGILATIIITLTYNYQELPSKNSKFFKPLEKYERHQPKIWISMAICWGQKPKFLGKDMFPYVLASTLSAKLWLTIFPTDKSI